MLRGSIVGMDTEKREGIGNSHTPLPLLSHRSSTTTPYQSCCYTLFAILLRGNRRSASSGSSTVATGKSRDMRCSLVLHPNAASGVDLPLLAGQNGREEREAGRFNPLLSTHHPSLITASHSRLSVSFARAAGQGKEKGSEFHILSAPPHPPSSLHRRMHARCVAPVARRIVLPPIASPTVPTTCQSPSHAHLCRLITHSASGITLHHLFTHP